MLAAVLVLDGGIGMRSEVRAGVYTGRADGPFTYREGKAEAIRELAVREGIDLAASLCLLDLGVRPADDARGRQPGGGEPDAALERTAKAEGWRIMRFDWLAPILKIGAALAAVALVGAWPRLRAGSAASRA